MKVISTLFLLLLSSITEAQNRISLEVMAQAQDCFILGDQKLMNRLPEEAGSAYVAYDKKFTFGMAAGVNAYYQLHNHACISLGALYSHQSQKFDSLQQIFFRQDTITYLYTLSLNYLKVPVLFHYALHPENKIAFSFYAGTYVAFLLSYSLNTDVYFPNGFTVENIIIPPGYAKQEISGKTISTESNLNGTVSHSSSVLASRAMNAIDFGLAAGAGVEIKLSDKVTLPVMLSYDIGLVNIKNLKAQAYNSFSTFYIWGDASNPNRTEKWNNSTLGVRVGLKFKV